jgi:hypothetical protein
VTEYEIEIKIAESAVVVGWAPFVLKKHDHITGTITNIRYKSRDLKYGLDAPNTAARAQHSE